MRITLSIQGAAYLRGVSRPTLCEAAKLGTLPFPVIRVGARVLVPKAPFEKALGSILSENQAA